MKYNTRKQQLQMGLVMSVLLFGTSACLAPSGSNMTLDTLLGQNGQAVAASTVSLMVSEQGSAASIYTDIGRLRSFSMTAGKSYIFKVSVAAMPSGSSIELQSVNTSLPSALQQTIQLNNGSGLMTPAVAGDYAFQITIKDAGGIKLVTKDYSAGVSCANPTFTADSLYAEGLSVSGSNNLYNYSAAAVITSRNGQTPFKCAYDLTGVGIVNTGFVDCTQPLANQYSPYIQNRKIGVVVKDACNTAYTVTKNVTLPATTPASPGNVFIAGVVSSETGTAANDVRVKGVNYLATNVGGHNIVSPSYGGQNF
ncbi:MAG: hypothetical protein H7333_08120, partial [Bdellovibrionales bacterium]|nr:hypothetical protein [Oligoflexia bacterium]